MQTIRRFILHHQKRHPREMGVDEIRQYLSHLATDGNVAASTQNVALCALLFLYRQVLKINLPLIENVERPNVRSACQLSSHPGRSGTYWQIFTAYT
ncbi:MAG: phage integrase N-terminal SAM-like domain-containing protein [Acidobacteriota bacterium]|nr:phage integrase N-terminal SAM-like domain-containing protein [Acidobacteriota bacterium]